MNLWITLGIMTILTATLDMFFHVETNVVYLFIGYVFGLIVSNMDN